MRAINFIEKDVNINGSQVSIDRVILIRTIDDTDNSKIIAIVKILLMNKRITLFEGVSYKALSEFTQQEIDNRIIQLI